MWTLDPDGNPTPIYTSDDPLVEEENKQERMIKVFKRSEADELAKQRWQAEIEFSQKSYWVQMAEDGDYMADGSDLQGYD